LKTITVKKVHKSYHKTKKNKLSKDNVTAIRNDVFIKDMEEKPTLITNLLQYTPANIVMNVIDGSNFREKDVLVGVWG
jgi:hypothetical protein